MKNDKNNTSNKTEKNERTIISKIDDQLSPGETALAISNDPISFEEAISSIIDNEQSRLVYISYRKPCRNIFNGNNYPLLVICSGNGVKGHKEESSNHYVLKSPESLTELSIILRKRLKEVDDPFVVFDSINAFLIYNDLSIFKTFFHYFITKVAFQKSTKVLFYTEDENRKIILPFLRNLVDEVVQLKQ